MSSIHAVIHYKSLLQQILNCIFIFIYGATKRHNFFVQTMVYIQLVTFMHSLASEVAYLKLVMGLLSTLICSCSRQKQLSIV